MNSSILGIGIDLVEVDRIRRGIARHGERFLERILSANERAYCERMADPSPHVAARFAAKEAVSKAMGTGIGAGVHFHEIEVVRDVDTGAPSIRLHGETKETFEAMGGGEILITLSHTRDHATAQAMRVRVG